MATSKAKTPEAPRGFEKGRKAMAMIMHALLSEAGYDVGYLGTPNIHSRTFTIGTWGTTKIAVCYQKAPRKYAEAKAGTEHFVSLINQKFGEVTPSASKLATYHFERGNLGAGPWHSIVVQVPSLITLRRLHARYVVK